jgi:hypothetical protein
MLTQNLDAAGVSHTIKLAPGQSVDFAATTDDLDDASLFVEQSANGVSWRPARDADGVLIPALVGADESLELTAVLKNEGVGFYRAVLVASTEPEAELVGSVDITTAERNDPAQLSDVVDVGDELVTFRVPVTLPDGSVVSGTIFVPTFADNAEALAAGAVIGSLWTDGAGAVAAVIAGE